MTWQELDEVCRKDEDLGRLIGLYAKSNREDADHWTILRLLADRYEDLGDKDHADFYRAPYNSEEETDAAHRIATRKGTEDVSKRSRN